MTKNHEKLLSKLISLCCFNHIDPDSLHAGGGEVRGGVILFSLSYAC